MSLTGPRLACQNPASADQPPVYIITDSSAEIIHPLEPVIVALLSPYGRPTLTSRELPKPLVDKFNGLLREGQRLFGCEQRRSWVIAIDQNTVVKIRAGMDMDHISNLHCINKYAPELPVPSFLGALRSGVFSYVFLSRLRGETLDSAWPTLTTADKAAVQSQLGDMILYLRRMYPLTPPFFLGSFSSGVCKFVREGNTLSVEKMYNENMLNVFLCNQGRSKMESSLVLRTMRHDHRLVLTWGDIQPRNIMIERNKRSAIRGSISITGLLHWNFAGWYPEHWEATRAIYLAERPGAIQDWIVYLPRFLFGDYPAEYTTDLAIRHCL
ncbi:hypothetical protein B0T11DRAFT_332178 [Plectosphaerella cucumerina]|uniref:Aminoglycoside phosphotransferase domain-containing protein n=1 Tax=Plectosphaerella cucumerina TaxID=40658 RepID=A0A8K0T9E3_9PEZI|nr:hypothetical protein B0T11DRAFT_332178 [Plectosphaerella cucumerina]